MVLGSVIGINNFNNNPLIYYAICSTAGDVTIKEVSIPNFQLMNNIRVAIKFQNNNTAINPLLNINNTGNKAIYYKNISIDANKLKANIIYDFIYYNNIFELIGLYDDIESFNRLILPISNTEPDNPINGQVYFNTTNNKLYIYNNEWIMINNN